MKIFSPVLHINKHTHWYICMQKLFIIIIIIIIIFIFFKACLSLIFQSTHQIFSDLAPLHSGILWSCWFHITSQCWVINSYCIVLNTYIGLFNRYCFYYTLLYQAALHRWIWKFPLQELKAHFESKISHISNHFFRYSAVSTALAFIVTAHRIHRFAQSVINRSDILEQFSG